MPGRRKKAASQLPPLNFINSPVYHPGPNVVQDSAVDHPVTARTVPVEEILETSWVSPQFSQSVTDRERQRQLLRKHSIRLCHRSQDANVTSSKFVPLQFVCRSNEEPVSRQTCHRNERVPLTNVRIRKKSTARHTTASEAGELENYHPLFGQLGFHDREKKDVDDAIEGNKVDRLYDDRSRTKDILGRNCDENVTPSCPSLHINSCVWPNRTSQDDQHSPCIESVGGDECSNAIQTDGKDIVDVCGKLLHCALFNAAQTPPSSRRRPVIMAMDTPESDYGLSHRQRQLKYGLHDALA